MLIAEPVGPAESSCRSWVPFSATPVSLYTGIHGFGLVLKADLRRAHAVVGDIFNR